MNKLGIAILAVSFLYAENGGADKMIAAQGTVVADCIKRIPHPTFEGEIDNVSTPISQAALNSKCNVTYTDCQNSCNASFNMSKTLKKRALKANPPK
ncbi:MAG: hypothetical protein H0X26_07270 [Alphaproteobacteria bacterium]|nr:hypothetical protein [Alphaproteobacteria bacterium]